MKKYSLLDMMLINFGGLIAVLPYLLFIPYAALVAAVEHDYMCVFGGEWIERIRDDSFMRCNPVPDSYALALGAIWLLSLLIIWPIHANYSRRASEYWKQ